MNVVAMPVTGVSGLPALKVSTVSARQATPLAASVCFDPVDDLTRAVMPLPVSSRDPHGQRRDPHACQRLAEPRRHHAHAGVLGEEPADDDHRLVLTRGDRILHVLHALPFARLAGEDDVSGREVGEGHGRRRRPGRQDDAADAQIRAADDAHRARAKPLLHLRDEIAERHRRQRHASRRVRLLVFLPLQVFGEPVDEGRRPLCHPLVAQPPDGHVRLLDQRALGGERRIGRAIGRRRDIGARIERRLARDDQVASGGDRAPDDLDAGDRRGRNAGDAKIEPAGLQPIRRIGRGRAAERLLDAGHDVADGDCLR